MERMGRLLRGRRTLVHVGRWVTGDSEIECREALAAPADPGRLVLLRRIRAVRGDARTAEARRPPREWENRWWTHSGLCAVAGLRAVAREVRGRAARDCDDLADTILRETRCSCLSPAGHWARAEDDEGPEAALLLPPARGCLPPGDP
ncbi:hypothetical protein [Streptomyces melanosporofaciens]|uniref:Uncharacterized protein n=1 Tax=Streptomyces melanosporofaciens TaxID=67327 RepID=A0A1H4I8A3_STRMJ|nr:hypothetical protein [Streptomyces melanosporofaciens]SEB29976.1 hypothetical protein SAMN04490356_0128 [Streptomyces melanosporofaciens]